MNKIKEQASILKGHIDTKKFNEFLNGEFKEAVIEFNSACGKSLNLAVDVESSYKLIYNESLRVLEECGEAIQAFLDRNRQERIDGIIDIYWTVTQFNHLVANCNAKFPELQKYILDKDKDDALQINLVAFMTQTALQVAMSDKINTHAIVAGAIRVMANNAQKYTTDPEVADDWEKHIDKETQRIKCVEYKGKAYYSISRRSDDYVVKPYNFKSVELSDL